MSRLSNLALWVSAWCAAPPRRSSSSASKMRLKDPPKRPDPAIYSQEFALANGETPTWLSQDLTRTSLTFHPPDGPPQTQHFITVICRNLGDSAAVNVLINAAYSEFGIGQPRVELPHGVVSLPAGATAEVKFFLPESAPLFPHILGLHAALSHPHDEEPGNNVGSRALLSSSTKIEGRQQTFECPVSNTTGSTLSLSITTFASPGLTVTCEDQLTLPPGGQHLLLVTVAVAQNMHGTESDPLSLDATVVARAPNFFDGVTFRMLVND